MFMPVLNTVLLLCIVLMDGFISKIAVFWYNFQEILFTTFSYSFFFFLDCSLRLYGSSCSRLGFNNSDVNIDVQFPAIVSIK